MATMTAGGKTVEVDEEGYLVNINDWTREIAEELAKSENVTMTDSHWEVIDFLTKAIGKKLGPEKGNSKYLYELFPYGPAKQACKIGGLPKPTGCI